MTQNQRIPALNGVVATTSDLDGIATFNWNQITFQLDGTPPHCALNVRDCNSFQMSGYLAGVRLNVLLGLPI